MVPDEFEVPPLLETDEYLLRPLTVDDVIRDYDAVMSSVDRLVGVFGEGTWPVGLTLAEDLVDLGWHQREFTLRHSFAYTVVTLDGTTCLGCVYLYPSEAAPLGQAADVYLWVRSSAEPSGLDGRLESRVREWLRDDWPFPEVHFPGR